MCGDGKESFRPAEELYQLAEQEKKKKDKKKTFKKSSSLLEDSFR